MRAPRLGSAAIALLVAVTVFAALRADLVVAQTTLTPGTQARVSADGDSLRLRAGATVSAAILASIPDGSIVNVRTGSTSADGYTWQFIEWGGLLGWVAAEYLQPLGTSTTPSPTVTPSVTATATPSPTPTPPATSGGSGSITGNLPPAGKAGMIVWSGGSMDALVSAASAGGCTLRSVYTIKDGQFVAYTPGAPAFVNAAWASRIGTLTGISGLLVYCDSPSGSAATTGSTGGSTTGGTPSSPATASNGGPPGPGGN